MRLGAGIALAACLVWLSLAIAQPRIGPPMPPVPPLPSVAHITNGAKVFRVTVAETTGAAPKADMPAALPVSENAPHHYYGIAEFKATKAGMEAENELFYFGWYSDEDSFRKAHGVGNPKFSRKFRAVIRVTSEMPNEPVCVWQRRDGFAP